MPQHFRDNTGLCVSCENGANVKQTMENLMFPLVLLVVLVLAMYVKRKKIKELRHKYGNVLRDVLRIVTINLSYTQINSSLPQVIDSAVARRILAVFEQDEFC